MNNSLFSPDPFFLCLPSLPSFLLPACWEGREKKEKAKISYLGRQWRQRLSRARTLPLCEEVIGGWVLHPTDQKQKRPRGLLNKNKALDHSTGTVYDR